MTYFGFVLSFLTLVSAAVVPAPAAAQHPTSIAGTLQVQFVGASTLHDFAGTLPTQRFAVVSSPGATTYGAEVKLPVAQLDTDNSWRDDKMRSMFEAQRFPEIIASFTDIDPASVRPRADGQPGALSFQLRIRDVELPMRATLTSWHESTTRVAFDAHFDVSLKAFGMQAPTVAGLVRVDDKVGVDVHVELTESQQRLAEPQS